MAALTLAGGFIVGFCIASIVWAVTMDRVTERYKLEIACIMANTCDDYDD
jgi:biotin transporter BioY